MASLLISPGAAAIEYKRWAAERITELKKKLAEAK
jgi:hypothetical protein